MKILSFNILLLLHIISINLSASQQDYNDADSYEIINLEEHENTYVSAPPAISTGYLLMSNARCYKDICSENEFQFPVGDNPLANNLSNKTSNNFSDAVAYQPSRANVLQMQKPLEQIIKKFEVRQKYAACFPTLEESDFRNNKWIKTHKILSNQAAQKRWHHSSADFNNSLILGILSTNYDHVLAAIEAGADLNSNAVNPTLNWALRDRIQETSPEAYAIFVLLLEKGASPAIANKMKENSLHIAITRDFFAEAKHLIITNAKQLHTQNHSGKTPLDLIIKKATNVKNFISNRSVYYKLWELMIQAGIESPIPFDMPSDITLSQQHNILDKEIDMDLIHFVQ